MADATFSALCLRVVREHDEHSEDLARADRDFDVWADRADDLEVRITDLRSQQVAWDHEAWTIQQGSRAFLPVRPAGEASMLAGVVAVLSVFFILATIGAMLP